MQSGEHAGSRTTVQNHLSSRWCCIQRVGETRSRLGEHQGVQLIGAVLGEEPLHPLGGTRGTAGRNAGGLEDGATPLQHPISGKYPRGKVKFLRANRVCIKIEPALYCDNRSCKYNHQGTSRASTGGQERSSRIGQGRSSRIGQSRSSRSLPSHRQHL